MWEKSLLMSQYIDIMTIAGSFAERLHKAVATSLFVRDATGRSPMPGVHTIAALGFKPCDIIWKREKPAMPFLLRFGS